MEIINTGTICSNKDFTLEDITEVIEKIFPDDSVYIKGNKEIVFDEQKEVYLQCSLRMMIRILSRKGHLFSGEITHYGDCEGYYIIKNNYISVYDKENAWKYFASDIEIIKVLEKRGYTVTRNDVLAS